MRIAMIGQKGIETGEKGGGIEKHVEEISKRLVLRGHDVFVYARRRSMVGKGKKIEGVHIIYIPTWYRKNIETILYAFFATLHALFGSYDIIHYHGVGPATLAWIPRLFLSRTKVVVTFHSQDRFHKKWSWIARWYLYCGEWAAVYFPHACIAVSHVLQVFVREHFGREVVYIPNGAEVSVVRAFDEVKALGFQPRGYLLNVGRIVPHKGIRSLMDAYLLLHRHLPEHTLPELVIVGAPSFTDAYFEQLKARAETNTHIHFLGFQTGEALRQLYAHTLLYVHPSEYEGLPLAILEAMSFGVPVLVSDIPENLEAMHHAGFSFHTKNVKDLAQKMQDLLSHPNLLEDARQRSKKAIQTYFDWDAIVEHTEEVYRTVRH